MSLNLDKIDFAKFTNFPVIRKSIIKHLSRLYIVVVVII